MADGRISISEYRKLPKVRRKPRVEREHYEQVELFAWAERETSRLPELALLFAIPNGGQRHPAVAAKLKAEGVKRGVPDTCLPVARGKYHGLFIELKAEGGKATEAQLDWVYRLRGQGYCAHVCVGCEEAKKVIEMYLSALSPAKAAVIARAVDKSDEEWEALANEH